MDSSSSYGESFSDYPDCVCPVIGAWARAWDNSLPDDATRTRLLLPLIPRLLGSRSTPAIESRRSWLALDWLARCHAPAFFDLAGLADHAQRCRGLAGLRDSASAVASHGALLAAREAAEEAAEEAAAEVAAQAADEAADEAEAAADAAANQAAAAAMAAAWFASDEGAVAWSPADKSINAARAVAWTAFNAAGSAAWTAARTAGTRCPSAEQLQASMMELLGQMLDLRELAE